jgi:hypothetical protein
MATFSTRDSATTVAGFSGRDSGAAGLRATAAALTGADAALH